MSKNHTGRLADLRRILKEQSLDGVLIPSADEYQGEYVPACAARLAWLTGFDGSSGIAVVLADRAALVVPPLYAVQARAQTDPSLYTVVESPIVSPEDWLRAHVGAEARIGYDPRLHTVPQREKYAKALADRAACLVPLDPNPVDLVWAERPPVPSTLVESFPAALAGRSVAEKRALTAKTLQDKGASAFVVTMPDALAWLLNIRAQDLPHVPVALSRAVLHADGRVDWFIDPARLGESERRALGPEVSIRPPDSFAEALAGLARTARESGRPVALDGRTTSAFIADALSLAQAPVRDMPDPCIEPRALKTPAEQAAMIETHRRDGLAVELALARVSRKIAAGESLTECEVSDIFLECRARDPAFRAASFATIAAFGPHAAMPHYRPVQETDARIAAPGILLIDSGGLYCAASYAGTTDITRTMAVGNPLPEARRSATLVLKGHIAVARAVFPEGTPGAQIDGLARRFLWREGLDYRHGTGHGVGCFLSVHEEAAPISPKGTQGLRAGMILSNEPGFYREGHYGIRIENLVRVIETGAVLEDGRRMLGFDTITLAPIDRALVDPALLTAGEKDWLNAYHGRVRAAHSEQLEGEDARAWLEESTAAL